MMSTVRKRWLVLGALALVLGAGICTALFMGHEKIFFIDTSGLTSVIAFDESNYYMVRGVSTPVFRQIDSLGFHILRGTSLIDGTPIEIRDSSGMRVRFYDAGNRELHLTFVRSGYTSRLRSNVVVVRTARREVDEEDQE